MNHLSVLLSKQTVNSQGEPHSLQNRAESVDTIIKSVKRSHWVMARPIPDLQKVSKLSEPATIGGGRLGKASLAKEQDIPYIEGFCRKKSNNNLVLARSAPHTPVPQPTPPPEPPDPLAPRPPEHFQPSEEPAMFPDQPAFLPPKPVPHSPKISPSSIPNPSPSVTTNKHVEQGYPNYGGYLYSIPGYSAFQPIGYQGLATQSAPPPAPAVSSANETISKPEFTPFPKIATDHSEEKKNTDTNIGAPAAAKPADPPKTDFEDHFTPEIIPVTSETKNQTSESKLSIASLAQGAGATVNVSNSMHDIKKKQTERFSLKTSIPISKIDMKCVNTAPEACFQTNVTKKTPVPFNPAFQTTKDIANNNSKTRVEIQSNVVIKTAPNKEPEIKTEEPIKQIVHHTPNNSISTLINAAEALNSSDNAFWKTDKNPEPLNKEKETFVKPVTSNRPIFNPMNTEPKINYSNKPPDGFSEQKNQIVFIQNKNPSNPKMLLTISQPPQPQPQVILQRTNCESKNMQAPSRLSSLTKKCKEELISENSTSSKVVALKRLHQENCDENDFENLITENQIYGNKIVVKEKTHGTLQEQEIKKNPTKVMNEKANQTSDTKNVVLQPNFVYLSNLQFPANLMMIKNSAKVNQAINDQIKINSKSEGNENKFLNENNVIGNNDIATNTQKATKPQISVTKEVHVLKSSNNVIQTITPKNNKTDLVFQTNQKVIMNSQILYQVPMIVDTHGITSNEQKINGQTYLNRDYTKFLAQNKKDMPRINENTKCNEKLYIACPYQMDSKLQPKIVITNLRPKIAKVEEISTLDLYEKRKRLRRLKHLTPREQKTDLKKERADAARNINTPDKIKAEICKEFTKTKVMDYDQSSESDSDGEESELKEYESIIKEFSPPSKVEDAINKKSFLSQFRLGTHEECKEQLLDRQERSLRKDAVAAAYISAGRIDRLTQELAASRAGGPVGTDADVSRCQPPAPWSDEPESCATVQKKQMFLSHLRLVQVSPRYRDDYEKIWHEIIKERRRRNGDPQPAPSTTPPTSTPGSMTIDTKDHLQILTEIKKSVHENNNLIKRRLDETQDASGNADSIHTLAEKNFSELSKLSKMADRSVKLFSGQDMKKRDVNPGFDSENMQRLHQRPCQNYANINIPNISKIISLRSSQEPSVMASAPATSMDEPQTCAAAPAAADQRGQEDQRGLADQRGQADQRGLADQRGQADQRGPRPTEDAEARQCASTWQGVDAVVRSFKEFETMRKKEIAELHRRSTQLRVESASANRAAARETELARTLLAERQTLASDEHNLRMSIQRIITSVDAIRSANLH